MAPSTLVDHDWELQYVLSSSTSARLNEPLLQLELRTCKPGASDVTTQLLELTESELDSVLEAFAKTSDALRACEAQTGASSR